ncbi:hypothetical protein VTJ04DRAFT_2752 [Mycothermus thermophilus]|uniref:uncharacterized protein n=1 Tax=Humicola insolens TaxID=85995 RepID=UPI003743162F
MWPPSIVYGLIWVWLSPALNILHVLTCSFPAIGNWVYRVNTTRLAEFISAKALEDSGSKVTPLITPELPTFWNVGISGVCDNFTITTPEGRPSWDAYCQKEFLPSQDILNILEGSLRRTFQRLHEQNQTDQKDSNTELLISNILTSWNESLAKISPSTLADEKKEVEELLLGSSILAITSAVTDVLAMAVGILTRWYRAAGVAFFLSAGMSWGIVIFTDRILERAMLGAADQDWGGALGAYVAFVSQIVFGLCLMTGCCYKDLQRAKELRRRRRMTLKNEAVENGTFELSSGMEGTAESPYAARTSVTSDGPGSPGMPQKSSPESTPLLELAMHREKGRFDAEGPRDSPALNLESQPDEEDVELGDSKSETDEEVS